MKHVLVCYDVVNDSRRTRLFEGLKGYLEPVQMSVFEGRLSRRAYLRMLEWIETVIDMRRDNVRVYGLCAGCVGEVERLGKAVAVATEPEDIVIG